MKLALLPFFIVTNFRVVVVVVVVVLSQVELLLVGFCWASLRKALVDRAFSSNYNFNFRDRPVIR